MGDGRTTQTANKTRMFDDNYIIDRLEKEEVAAAYEIEAASSADDGDLVTTHDQLEYRHRYACDLFLGIFSQPRTKGLLGYVSGTLSNDDALSTSHDPSGHTVCIHSLSVHPQHRDSHIPEKLFAEYMRRLDESSYNRAVVYARKQRVPFFEHFKFKLTKEAEDGDKRQSDLFELVYDIIPQRRPTLSQADILAALNKPQPKPSPLTLTPFTDHSSYDAFVSELKNSRNARCPRDGCRSLVFLAREAELKDLDTVHPLSILLPNKEFSHPSLPPPHMTKAWRLPSPMSFENITFSKIAPGTPANVSKFLACGECEIGSLGWVDNSGCWIDMKRVLYE
ncbi:hypothetical protein E3P80_02929 [Wallemia ichthyophaga]|nr:hypothetical protein E3P97_02998 [Wallemia ichthyophaga]TIB30487.1 hypothetical protein E3P85_02692 [Wallemia ichthyophaga]TIB51707.1 hypothetical protein E3P80_02929 [Wallemia ichthyophaga]TIB57593.1 hypothetical protein E3P79_02926 [Wallemia ichthyophaga]